MFNYDDIEKKVKSYEDMAKYYTDFYNALYAKEIKEGRYERREVPSPRELAMELCMTASFDKMEADRSRASFLDDINGFNERLDKIEDLLDELTLP